MILGLLKLFYIFFKIGLFTFGGGYAMIPMISQEMVNGGYLTIDQVNQFIGIAESTPGPFAVNIATFSGFETYGVLGSVVATLGVVLPSFIIILLIASFGNKFIKSKSVQTILQFLNPIILGLILSAAISVTFHAILGEYFENISFDYIALIIFSTILVVSLIFKRLSPIHLILISAVLGIVFYAL